jgi:hypothetical protein
MDGAMEKRELRKKALTLIERKNDEGTRTNILIQIANKHIKLLFAPPPEK